MARRLLGLTVVTAAALALTGGAAAALSLTLGSAPSFGVTLDGSDQTPAYSLGMTVSGMNGAFNITASATQFTAAPNSLGFPTVTGTTTGACSGGACVTPTNTIATFPIGLTGTAQKIYSSRRSPHPLRTPQGQRSGRRCMARSPSRTRATAAAS